MDSVRRSINCGLRRNNLSIQELCKSIKLKDVEISIAALDSLKKNIELDTLTAMDLQLITETVTKIEFTSTESELVEEGYFQAVRVCCSMVKGSKSNLLTNGLISEIIIFCFRVVNSKLVKYLRSKAARSLLSITKIAFRRLAEFPEDPTLKPSYQIRIRLGAPQSFFKELADSQSTNSNDNNSSSSLRIINERHQPYNLAFINDYFCYLDSMINPTQDDATLVQLNKVQEERIFLGLKLLKIAFHEAADDIGSKSCLIYTTRNNICYNIIKILKTCQSMPIITNALDLAVNIFVGQRCHLKYQFEAFLECLMDMLPLSPDQSLDPSSQSSEIRSDVLYAVLELFINIKNLPHELYYNYDCDPYASNIYENLIQICSKSCFQHSIETQFTPIQLTSFDCLLKNLSDIYKVELSKAAESIASPSQPALPDGVTAIPIYEGDDCNMNTSIVITYEDINNAKKRKLLLWLALDKFNSKPKDGVQFMKENNLITDNAGLVQILKDNLRVDKKVLGEFLSKAENKDVREAFIGSLDFSNLRMDEAMRLMLEKFRIPGESQLIERILDAFANRWVEQNPGILPDCDTALSLAYGIILLNVDQHNKKVEKPMTCDEFDKNLFSPTRERVFDRKLIDIIYTNIRNNEIVLPDEQVGSIRQRYLWKCTLAKSERPEAYYWEAKSMTPANVLSLIDMNKIIFEIMWNPTLAALSFIFDKIDPNSYAELSRLIVDEGFIKFAHLCAHHGHLDNLVVNLCKFTTNLNPVPHNNSHIAMSGLSDKNSLAALSLLSIIRDYANSMRDSWSNVVRNIIQWYCSRYMDDVVRIDDFALQRKLSLRMREVKKSPSTMNQQSSTFLRSVYTYFAGQQPSPNEDKADCASNNAPSAIQVLIQTIQDAEYSHESLSELIAALTSICLDGDPEEVEDGEVFKLEIFTQVLLNNKEQAFNVWPRVRAYFARQTSLCGNSIWLGERIISSAFRIAIQFKPKMEVLNLLNQIIATLDADIIRGDHTFVALMTLTELHSPDVTMDAKDLESCFNQVIFFFMDKVLENCDPVQHYRTLNRAINLLSKIFLKHLKLLKSLNTFALLWIAILDTMEKYIKASSALREATFELVKNMVLVMDNDGCMTIEMKDVTRTKFMFWEYHQTGTDY